MSCERIQWIIKNGEKALSPQYRDVPMLLPYKIAKLEYEPLGVVAAIIPWNYPYDHLTLFVLFVYLLTCIYI